MLTLFAFIVALVLLIAVHEYGHYRVAVACGVKVLRFSIGMGKPLFRWKARNGETEFVIAALPLGGYVRMLDEREGEVDKDELHRSFHRQSLRKKAAIVAAGPAANLLLAIALYSVVNWVGLEQPQAVVAAPPSGSLAAQAGLKGGERIHMVQMQASPEVSIQTFEDLRWQLMQAVMKGQDAVIHWTHPQGAVDGRSVLHLSRLNGGAPDSNMWSQIGITGPWASPIVGQLLPGMPAQEAGLQTGDLVLQVNDQPIVDAAQLRGIIRNAAAQDSLKAQVWSVRRDSELLHVTVVPEIVSMGDQQTARIGAYIGASPSMVLVRKNIVDGALAALSKTWETSVLSVQMILKMLIGQASLQNLSGPLSIADYAGQSASMGLVQYILFLALVSVSLGVLNLLPLPVLDGGHLMYYLWEGVTGHPVSEAWLERLQRVGICLLLVMMSIALFNDIGRIWG